MLRKSFLIITTLFTTAISIAQETSSSPYSFFGIGESKLRGTQDVRSMGDLSIKADSIAININNPASYSRLLLTTFSVGGTTQFNSLQSNSEKESAQRTSLDYLVVGIPMGKFGGAFGITPYSSVGYRIQNEVNLDYGTPDTSDDETRLYQYQGEGSISRVFAGMSYNINKQLSVGVNLEYNFGNSTAINRETVVGVQLTTRERNENSISGFSTNIGLMYQNNLSNDNVVYGSFNFVPESKLKSENFRNIATVSYSPNGTEFVTDFYQEQFPNSEIILPSKLSFGFGYGMKNKWMLGSQITFSGTENMVNRFSGNTNSSFENGHKISLGGFYIPKYDSYSSFFKRIVYRAGFRYDKTGLIVNNESIIDYGMNFGMGIPVGISKIELGFEIGKRGTTSNGLIQENYFNIGVGLSLTDKWFKKTLID